jgi:formate-nitrite transporter family protein
MAMRETNPTMNRDHIARDGTAEIEDGSASDAGQGGAAEAETISDSDAETVEERSRLPAPLIYEIVRRMGEEEMERPTTSLWWSGVAAGLSISFSLLAQAILQARLPDTSWRPLVTSLGYPVGFLIVVLARQQLFTENTITPVLPLAAKFTFENLRKLARLWVIVFAANMTGTAAAAVFCTLPPVLAPELRDVMIDISRHILDPSWFESFFRAITAGFLIAAMVWLIPSAEAAAFHVIALMTYLIAVGGFQHVVAGSVEAFMLVINGQLGLGHMIAYFLAPVLLGNIVGGTVLFTLISHAQVMNEIPNPSDGTGPPR